MAVFFVGSIAQAACPRFPNPISPDQIWQNDQDLDDCITQANVSISSLTTTVNNLSVAGITPGSTNYIQNRNTLQSGATAYPSFLYIGSSATIPTLSVPTLLTGSSATITNTSATNATVVNSRISTETWQGFGVHPILDFRQYTTVTSSAISHTTFHVTNLSGSITPKVATSSIAVIMSGNVSCTGAGVCYATLYRDSTNLSGDGGFETNTAASNNHTTVFYIDSPNTTSAVTYSVRIRVNGGGVTAAFPGTDGGVNTTTAILALVEIAQ